MLVNDSPAIDNSESEVEACVRKDCGVALARHFGVSLLPYVDL